jgi:AcrR family transcriptional regulator
MKPARNGDRIAQSALELFCGKGYKGTSVRMIAECSGVSVGNLYNHASGKEELFDRLFAERFPGAHIERIFSDIRPGAELAETVEAVLGNMLRYADSDPYFFRLVMVDLNEFGGAHLRRYGEPYDRPLAEIVASLPDGSGLAGAVGALRSDVEGGEFTRFFLWLFFAVGFTAAMRKAMTDKEVDDGTFRTVLKVLQRGVSESGEAKGRIGK